MTTDHNDEIHTAVATGDLGLLKKHVDEHPEHLRLKNREGCTPLVVAARDGHLEAVQLLVDNGADLEVVDPEYKRTALAWAAFHGHLPVVAFLLEHGASVNTKDGFGHTPLATALMGEEGGWAEWVSIAPHEYRAIADLLQTHETRATTNEDAKQDGGG